MAKKKFIGHLSQKVTHYYEFEIEADDYEQACQLVLQSRYGGTLWDDFKLIETEADLNDEEVYGIASIPREE